MSSYTRQQLENWLREIDVGDVLVLDVGGAQNPVKGRTKSWNAKRYDILDLPEPHEWNARPDILADIQEINWKDEYFYGLKGAYDIVFCLEVSEYWFNPLGALRNIARFLREGGLLYISFHFLYPHHNPEKKDFLRYTRWGVEKLLKGAGFKILEIRARNAVYPDKIIEFYDNEGMRGIRNLSGEIGYLVKAIKENEV